MSLPIIFVSYEFMDEMDSMFNDNCNRNWRFGVTRTVTEETTSEKNRNPHDKSNKYKIINEDIR